MLTRIRLENLKCFSSLSLPLSSLTLLTGFNAAGKSTVLQALLLLTQAARVGGRSLFLPLNGPLVRLGTVGEVLNEKTEERILTIEVETAEASLTWRLSAENRAHATALRVDEIEIRAGEFQFADAPKGPLVELLPVAEYPRSVRTLTNAIRDLIFISAVRVGSADSFPSPDTPEPTQADVGTQGEFAPWWFARSDDEEIPSARHHPGEEAPTLRRQLDAWANELFPGAESNARRLDKTPLVLLELRNHKTDAWRRPANIGYGLSYAFPILVAALLAKSGQTLVIDSPEAHLHPRAQSRLGGFLAKMAAAGVQVLLETHSDHVVNGVRLAVYGNVVQPTSVGIHFFNLLPRDDGESAHVISTHIDENGQLRDWPEGFFDQGERDLSELAGWT